MPKVWVPKFHVELLKLAAKYQTHMSERIKDEQPDCFNIFNMISISSDFEGLQACSGFYHLYVLIEASHGTVGDNQNLPSNRDDAEMRAEAGWRVEDLMQCILIIR